MKYSGLVSYEPYSGVRLTEWGETLAMHVLRRHRFLELSLVEVMGLDWSEVHAEAVLLEHAVSDRFLERMNDMLGRPSVDPHGDPIPDAEGMLREGVFPTLVSCALAEPMKVVWVRDQTTRRPIR